MISTHCIIAAMGVQNMELKLRPAVVLLIIKNVDYGGVAYKNMQKSRLGEKYNSIRHSKDPFYSNYMLKIFLSKLTRSGEGATGQRQVETALKAMKMTNFMFTVENQPENLTLKKKRLSGLLRKRSYLLRSFYSYLRGRLSAFKMLHFALKNL